MSNADIALGAKIACLSRPETYEGHPIGVEAIETHFAWVFLAGRFAYKMKKPLKFREFDLTTLATRRANCELEVALNGRLAPAVYLGTVPLARTGSALVLEGAGTPVEWLVKMVRLPRERALDRHAVAGALDDGQLRTLLEKLARFYETAARAPWDGRGYRRALANETELTAAELAAPTLELDTARVEAIAAELRRRLAADAPAFHARVADGRVVDAHGDLRPEHVFLLPSRKSSTASSSRRSCACSIARPRSRFSRSNASGSARPRSASACSSTTECARATIATLPCSTSTGPCAPSCARRSPPGISRRSYPPRRKPPGTAAHAGISTQRLRASASNGVRRSRDADEPRAASFRPAAS